MDRDTIIRLAVEAKLVCHWDGGCASAWVEGHDLTPYLERFAALVAAAERAEVERLRALCEEMLSELFVYRASENLKDVTAAIRARGKE
jgi:hypothetical protein